MLGEFILLRPLWLLALPLVAWFIWQMGQRTTAQWQPYIAPELLRPLVRTQQNRLGQWLNRASRAGLLLLPIALAGPALERPADDALAERPLVIVLDQSLSMLSEDLSPDRHTRARQKIQDWLRAHPERPVGLVAYAGSAHVVTPLTFDHSALNTLLRQLSPLIMPMPGSNPVAGLDLALAQLNEQAGDILWFTDELLPEQRLDVPAFTHRGQQLGIIVPGSPDGAPIRLDTNQYLRDGTGNLVTPGVNTEQFSILANESRVRWSPLTIGDADWQQVLTPQSVDTARAPGDDLTVTFDLGLPLMILALPGLLMWFRRGQLMSVALIGLGTLMMQVGVSTPAQAQNREREAAQEASGWVDWFRSPDQQGRARLPDNPDAAWPLFRSDDWRAYAALEATRFTLAADLLADAEHPRSLYNRANAMVHLERYDAAIADYEAALELAPDFTEAAENLALVEEFLRQPPPEDSADEESPPDGSPGEGDPSDSDAPSQSSDDTDTAGTTGLDPDDGGAQILEDSIRRRLPEADATFLQRKFQYQYDADPEQSDNTGPGW